MKLLKELLNESAQATTIDIVALEKAVRTETSRGHNSGNVAADRAEDHAVDVVIRTAIRMTKRPGALQAAEAKLKEYLDNFPFNFDELPQRKQGDLWGRFDAWRSVIKFLGGKLDPKVEKALFLDDILDIVD